MALAVFSACQNPSGDVFSSSLMAEGEAAVDVSDYAGARRIEALGKQQSADSVEWYAFEVLAAKRHFMAMQTDSFCRSIDLLRRFVAKSDGHDDPRVVRLAIECEMQQGVFENKMAGRMDSALLHYQRADALISSQMDDIDKSDRLFARSSSAKSQLASRLIVNLMNTADAHKQGGHYDESIDNYLKALSTADEYGQSDRLQVPVNLGIAAAYTAMGNFEESRRWWEKAGRMRSEMTRFDQFNYLNNRGSDYFLQRDYDASLRLFLELDSLLAAHPDMHFERMFCHINLSDVYIHLGKCDLARPLLDEVEPFFRSEDQMIPLYYAGTQRIELALCDNDLAQAKAVSDASQTPSWMIPEQLLLRLEVLLKLYERRGDWKDYSMALRQYGQLSDSIADQKTQLRISSAIKTYEHEREMLVKQQQLEEKDFAIILSTVLFAAALVVIMLLVWLILQSRRTRRLKEMAMQSRLTSLRMASVRNRITPHFICNALANEMNSQSAGNEARLDTLVELLHRGMEMTGTAENTLAEELEFVSYYCSIESRTVGPDFRFVTDMAPDVDANRVYLPAMTIQIIVENSIRHGLKPKPVYEGSLRTVCVSARQAEGGTLIEVTDNGVGFSPDTLNRRHTGLAVITQTIEMLNVQQQNLTGTPLDASGQISLSYGNIGSDDAPQGARSTLFLPHNFCYTLRNQ